MKPAKTPDRPDRQNQRLGFLFSGTTALGALSAVLLVLVPGDPENAWFLGFSRVRTLMLGGLVAVIPASLFFYWLQRKDRWAPISGRALARLDRPGLSAVLMLACQAVFAGSAAWMLRLLWLTDGMARGLLLRQAPLLFFAGGFAAWLFAWLAVRRPGGFSRLYRLHSWAWVRAGLLIALVLPLAYSLRMVALDDFVTTDEVLWAARSANFYYALRTGDLALTNQKEHPGVTTMWAGALAASRLFPDYVDAVGGEIGPGQLTNIHLRAGLPGNALIAAGRGWVVTVNMLILAAVLAYLAGMFGFRTALFAGLLLALDPFFIAHSRLLHPDSFLGPWMLLAICALLAYGRWGRGRDLLISGAAAGLSWLTKSPGFFLVAMAGALLLFSKPVDLTAAGIKKRFREILREGIVWAGAGTFVFFLFWPALLVEPLRALGDVFGQALGYAPRGHGGPVFFNGQVYPDGRIPALQGFYPLALAWRLTPAVMIGALSSLPVLVMTGESRLRKFIGGMWMGVLVFILLMNLGMKKFDRYILPVFPLFALLASLGWTWVFRRIKAPAWAAGLGLFLIALLQILAAWGARPYYLSYYNTLLGGVPAAKDVMMIGWGEGLNEAAGYLAGKAGARGLAAASFYSDGSFSYFFPGESIPIPSTGHTDPDTLAALLEADYIVLYYQQLQRGTPAELLEYLSGKTPEYVVKLEGLDLVQVFNMKGLRR